MHGRCGGPTTSTRGGLALDSRIIRISAILVLTLKCCIEFRNEACIALNVRQQVQLHDGISRYVGRLVLEAAMHVDRMVVYSPDGVTEALDRAELLPFGVLRLIYFHMHALTDLVGSAAKDDHECANKDGRVLIARQRLVAAILVRRPNPVPSTVPMAAQSPSILKSGLIFSAATEDDHHAGGAAHVTHGGRMVHAHIRSLTLRFELEPRERRLVNVEAPHVIDGL